jgi:hypothetical protein
LTASGPATRSASTSLVQAGCFAALFSSLIGTAIGAAWTLISGDEPPILELGVFALLVGYLGGFAAIGLVLGRLERLVPGFRSRSPGLLFNSSIIAPGLLSLLVFVLTPGMTGAKSEDLWRWSAFIVGAVVVVGLASVFLDPRLAGPRNEGS